MPSYFKNKKKRKLKGKEFVPETVSLWALLISLGWSVEEKIPQKYLLTEIWYFLHYRSIRKTESCITGVLVSYVLAY